MSDDCIFCRIVRGELGTEFVATSDLNVAFPDLSPQAPVHILIVPRQEIAGVATVPDSGDHLHLINAAKEIAVAEGLMSGYRLVINQGEDAGQSVDHLHMHLLGGRKLEWPPG